MKWMKRCISVFLCFILTASGVDVQAQEVKEERLSYFVVESPYVQTPQTQRFVASLEQSPQEVQLVYQNDKTLQTDRLIATRQKTGIYVFEKEFFSSDAASYSVLSLNYEYEGKKHTIDFSQLEMDVRFGVDEWYEGYGQAESVILDEKGEEMDPTAIVRLDGDTIEHAEDAFEEKLVSTYSLEPIVIAIDAGHGGTDGGTSVVGGGYEKEYTLKIARYLEKELAQYENVSTIMTRENDEYIGLEERAIRAEKAGAKALISLHLNATGFGTQSQISGAEVYYPHANYRPDIHEIGKELAQSIQDELVGLGIFDRGIKVKYIYDENTMKPTQNPKYDYPDGSVGDYYAVIRHSKKRGIVGLIVEHCMADNWNDYNRFLSSEQKLQQLAKADARGIAKTFGLKKKGQIDQCDELAQAHKNELVDGSYQIFSQKNKAYGLENRSGNVELKQNPKSIYVVSHDAVGYVTFMEADTKKVICVESNQAGNSINIGLHTASGSINEKWIAIKEGDAYKIVSALDDSFVLDLHHGIVEDGSNIQLYTSNDSSAQRWQIKKYIQQDSVDAFAKKYEQVLKDGMYTIHSSLDSNYVLDGNENSNVQLWKKKDSSKQVFQISHDEKGYVILTQVPSGKVLSVDQAKAANSQNVQLEKNQNKKSQKWIVEASGIIHSALQPDFVLDLHHAIVQNGSNIQVYTSNNTQAQRWKFIEYQSNLDDLAHQNKNVLADGQYTIHSGKDGAFYLSNASNNVELSNTDRVWNVHHDEQGYVIFTEASSGLVMSVEGGVFEEYQNVCLDTDTKAMHQKWIVTADGTILSAKKKDLVVDLRHAATIEGGNIRLFTSNGTLAQKWVFEKVETSLDALANQNKNVLADGQYTIHSGKDGAFYLSNASNNVELSNTDRVWNVHHDEQGYVIFTEASSGLVMSVEGGVFEEYQNVCLDTDTKAMHQKWIVTADGTILSAKKKNLVVDLRHAATIEGGNIRLFTSNGTLAQKWVFELCKEVYQEEVSEMTPIMGVSATSVERMVAAYKQSNPVYDEFMDQSYNGCLSRAGAPTIEDFCRIFYEEANLEGVRAEMAFSQAMIETDWLRFSGDVPVDHYDFSGLEAIGNGVSENCFSSVREGIRAQIQHLKCYASLEPLNQPCVDPHWSESLRGKAAYVEYLSIPNNPYGIGWSVSQDYANRIIGIMYLL